MIDNLNDINRVLLALDTLEATRARTPRRLLLRYLNGEVIYGQNPPFEPILEFLKQIHVLSEQPSGFGLTMLGREVLAQNAVKAYELRPSQQPLLLRKCYLDGPFRSETKALVKKFEAHPVTGRLGWSSIDSEPLGDVEWIAHHLVQLDVLQRSQHMLEAVAAYSDLLASFQDEGGDFTEAQFRKVLKDKRETGEIAESFVLKWEQKRLQRNGHRTQAACVNRISKRRVNAGYDIESFDGPSKLLAHDRFIEVKGSGQPTVRFVWTPNEMQKAATLGARYWIYFVGGIQRKKRIAPREPVMLRDPHATLNPTSGFTLQPKGEVLVSANIAGQMLRTSSAARG